MDVRFAAALLALTGAATTGCFIEATASAMSCPAETPGCPCGDDGACPQSYDCITGACVQPNCMDGTQNCFCIDGECLPGLVCLDEPNTCHPEESDSESAGSQTGPSSATGTSGTSRATSSATTSGMGSGSGTSLPTRTGGMTTNTPTATGSGSGSGSGTGMGSGSGSMSGAGVGAPSTTGR